MILQELDLGKTVAAEGTYVLFLLLREVSLHVESQILLPVELLPAFLQQNPVRFSNYRGNYSHSLMYKIDGF
jgi:hypothetical protein